MDLKGDGILRRIFLKLMQARSEAHQGVGLGKLTLPARTELIVQLPVSAGSRTRDDLVEKAEITSGVYLVESLVKVNNSHIITSILNTREKRRVTQPCS